MPRAPTSPQNRRSAFNQDALRTIRGQVAENRQAIKRLAIRRHQPFRFGGDAGGGVGLAITPEQGIFAAVISGDTLTMGKASCYELKVRSDSSGIADLTGERIEIHNPVRTAIQGETLIGYETSADNPNIRIAILEDCADAIQSSFLEASAPEVTATITAADTYVDIPYVFTASTAKDFSVSNNEITYTGTVLKSGFVRLDVTFAVVQNNRTYQLRVLRNGTPEGESQEFRVGNVPLSVSFAGISGFAQNDVFKFQVKSVGSTTNAQLNAVINILATPI